MTSSCAGYWPEEPDTMVSAGRTYYTCHKSLYCVIKYTYRYLLQWHRGSSWSVKAVLVFVFYLYEIDCNTSTYFRYGVFHLTLKNMISFALSQAFTKRRPYVKNTYRKAFSIGPGTISFITIDILFVNLYSIHQKDSASVPELYHTSIFNKLKSTKHGYIW